MKTSTQQLIGEAEAHFPGNVWENVFEIDDVNRPLKRLSEKRNGLYKKRKNLTDDSASSDILFDMNHGTFGEVVNHYSADIQKKNLINQIDKEIKLHDCVIDKCRNGTYGLCNECSAQIPLGKLNTNPLSLLCTICEKSRRTDLEWWNSV